MNNIYHSHSLSFRYGMLATLPLFLHYLITEKIALLVGSQLEMIVTAEIILRKIPLVFMIPFLAFLWFKEREKMGPINVSLGDMKRTIREALPFAGILWVTAFLIFLVQPHAPGQNIFPYLPMMLAMKSGTGFFEEFLCRMILLGGTLWIFQRCKISYAVSAGIAIIFSSLAFAEMHYFHFFPALGQAFGAINDPSNPYTLGNFLFRFLSGAFLGWVYVQKGFATGAWTHAIYGYFQLFLM
jgi:hypothetical protein